MSRQPHNSRAFQGRMERELVAGGTVVGLLVGLGLIYLFWGASAAWTAIALFAGFAVLALVIWAILKVIEWAGGKE